MRVISTALSDILCRIKLVTSCSELVDRLAANCEIFTCVHPALQTLA